MYVQIAVSQLRVHPSNIRRFYPREDIERMAASLRKDGLRQALEVVTWENLGDVDRAQVKEEPGVYYVVDGNFRLNAFRFLAIPEQVVDCKVVEADRSEQLRVMALTTALVIPKDPISVARHYRRMRDEEGYSITAISRAVQHSPGNINDYLILLDLDEEIQDLIAEGKLSRQKAVTEALLSIPDSKARIKLAQRMANAGATAKVLVSAAQKVVTALKAQAEERESVSDAPALRLAVKKNGFLRMPTASATISVDDLRATAKAMCDGCEQRHEAMAHTAEPAWLLVVNASVATCKACPSREVEDACDQCPSVDLLRRLMKNTGAKMEAPGYG